MAILWNKLLLLVLLVTLLQRTNCQIFSSQQEGEDSPLPRYPQGYPGGPPRIPGEQGLGGGGFQEGPGIPGGRFPGGPGGRTWHEPPMQPPGEPGLEPSGLHPGAFEPDSRLPFDSEGPWPSFQERGEVGAVMSNLDSSPDDTGAGTADRSHLSYGSVGSVAGPSIDEEIHHDSIEDTIGHNGAAGTEDNDSKGGTDSELLPGVQESVKSQGIRQNMTSAGTPDDDFNYVGMYITVAVFITFMVTLVAIALIRGPQGPFKAKRTEEEIARGLTGCQTAGDIVMLSDGAETRTDAQWEEQPLRSDCNDAVTDIQVSSEATAVAREGSTTVTMTAITSKEECV